MSKVFRGVTGETERFVEVCNEGQITRLSLQPGLEIVKRPSPPSVNWGYRGIKYGGLEHSLLAVSLLYEVTGDVSIVRRYYQRFRIDYVCLWEDSWQMTEEQVNEWLRDVGGEEKKNCPIP